MNFHDMLTEANREEPTKSWPITRWDPILEEFCAWLNERYREFLGASMKESWGDHGAPRVRTLRLWPRGQRNVQRTVLAVQTTEKSARVLGADGVEIEGEEELRKWLVAFSRHPRFREALDTLKDLASQPIEGVLRANAERRAKGLMSDIIVEVSADQQRRLADASEATPAEHIDRLYVVPINPPVWGKVYSADTKPIWLIAGGYALEIDAGSDALEPEGRIRLSGKPVPSSVLEEEEQE